MHPCRCRVEPVCTAGATGWRQGGACLYETWMAPAECHESGAQFNTDAPNGIPNGQHVRPLGRSTSQPEEPTTHLGHLRSEGLRRLLELGPYDSGQFLMSFLKVPRGPPYSAGTARTRTYTLNFRTMPEHSTSIPALCLDGATEQRLGGGTGLERCYIKIDSVLMESPSAH